MGLEAQFWVSKSVKIVVFGNFLKKFSVISYQYCFTCPLEVLLEVGEYGPQRPNFWVTSGPQIGDILSLW